MPVIKSAIKKLRKDRKREKLNDEFDKNLKSAIKKAKKTKSSASVTKAVSTIDKAVKKNLIHKNKAARIKSSLSKLARPEQSRRAKPAVTKPKKTSKKVVKTVKKSKK